LIGGCFTPNVKYSCIFRPVTSLAIDTKKTKTKLHKNEGGVGKPEQLRLTATGNVGEVGKDEIFIIFVTATIINLHEIVFHVQESWHYTKRQPTVVHGQTFCIIA
jgi:hypothetical protein